MKWVSFASLLLATLVLIGPRFEWSVQESEHLRRGLYWSGSGTTFLVLLLTAAISGGVYLLRRH